MTKKEWKKRNDAKKLRHRLKQKRKHKGKVLSQLKSSSVVPPQKFNVPKTFSIIKNSEETIKFLNDITAEVDNVRKHAYNNSNKKIWQRSFFIDMRECIEITSDALMFLLTIIRNTRGKKTVPIHWRGNLPENNEAKEFVKQSGYLNYMRTATENLMRTTTCVQIQTGKSYEFVADGKKLDIRTEVIDFTGEKLNKPKTALNFLMTMLTEMVTNITDHAYVSVKTFENSWYIFVADDKDKISYTFMDNGLGIPTTIKKSAVERMAEKLEWQEEFRYIESAVRGIKRRSITGKIERGNGLPSIYEQYTKNKIDNLVIISNKAYYSRERKYDMSNALCGTVYYWEIKKEEMVNGN